VPRAAAVALVAACTSARSSDEARVLLEEALARFGVNEPVGG
jgi:hypothetical protein